MVSEMSDLRTYCSKIGLFLTRSNQNSDYFMIDSIKLRVSDHISKNTDALVQIIEHGDKYVMCLKSGLIDICSYSEIQMYIRLMKRMPSMFGGSLPGICKVSNKTVLGVPFGTLTKGQQKAVKMAISKHLK